ncbi:MAG: retroviral-like aspartic protease [Chloroflexota bacterium]
MLDGHRFPYVPVRSEHGEVALRAQLPLVLSHRGRSRQAVGLLDSGADVNVLPYGLGIDLGAVWAEQLPVVRLSGNLANFEARGIILDAAVGHYAPVRLAFAWTRAEHVPLLLGQVTFFAEFDVCFYRSQGAFEVRPRGSAR